MEDSKQKCGIMETIPEEIKDSTEEVQLSVADCPEMPDEKATEVKKTMRQFPKYCLSVLGCFIGSFLLYVLMEVITAGQARAALVEAFLCFLACLGSCLYVYQTHVFKVKPNGILPIVEFVIAHIFSVSLWQLMINSMVTHKYSVWMALLVPTVNIIVISYFYYKDVVFQPKVKHISKRWILAIVAAILCIPIALQSFVGTIYHALDTANYVALVEPTTRLDDTRTFSPDGKYAISGVRDFHYPLQWDDSWFAQDLSQFNPELAYAASVMSAAAYYECRERISGVDFSSEEFWGNLGFDWINVTSFHYRSQSLDKFANLLSGDSNGAAYVVAGKDLVTGEGDPKKLLVISICGSFGFDFADDLLMGQDDHAEYGHEGFYNAAIELAMGILGKEGLVTDDTVIFVCGHSRGAAVANLLAVELEEILYWAESKAKVCAYTFACPNAAGAAKVRMTECNTVFNIINPYDLVTLVPFDEWGFDRYGKDMLLFDPHSELPDGTVEEIIAIAKKLEGKDYYIDYSDSDHFAEGLLKLTDAVGDSPSSLTNPVNMFRFIQSMMIMKPGNYLRSHSLPMYIAWLFRNSTISNSNASLD